MGPLVSVLTPTYNRAHFIEGAIRTVRQQTYENVESVVVNDGSTDDTRAVLRPYEDVEDVQVYHNEENRGIAHSFNRAAAEADGTFLCILGDDDRWHPEKVERQVARMDALPADYGVVCTDGVVTRDGDVILRDSPSLSGEIYPDVLADFGLSPHSGHMITREAFEDVGGFDTDFPRGVDWEMSIRLARDWKFDHLEEALVERKIHDDNVSGAPDREPVHEQIRETFDAEISQFPEIERQFTANCHQRRARAALQGRGNYRTAVEDSWLAFRTSPTVYRLSLLCTAVMGRRAYDAAVRMKHAASGFVGESSETMSVDWVEDSEREKSTARGADTVR